MTTLEDRIIDVSFQYSLQESKCLDMATSFRENVSVLSPFLYSFAFFDENLLQVSEGSSFQSRKPFFMCATLQPLTPYPLDVVSSEISLSEPPHEGKKYFDVIGDSSDFCVPEFLGTAVGVSKKSNYQLWYKIVPTEECPLNEDVAIGSLNVVYKRSSQKSDDCDDAGENETDKKVLLNSKATISPLRFETPMFTIERRKVFENFIIFIGFFL